MTDKPREPWHLDRRVPIATIAVLLGQIVLGVMWVTSLSNNVVAQAERIDRMEAASAEREGRLRAVELMLASQASDLRNIQVGIGRIEATLERMTRPR